MEELKAYHALILDAWQALKRFMPVLSDDPALWDEIINTYGNIGDKYKGTAAEQFAIVFCCDCMRELERVNNGLRRSE